jgi:nickel-type superoxide dismutase maturation protease
MTLSTILGVALVTVVAKRRLVRLEVEGVSMVPVLAPGDRILVLRTDQIAVGDIIACTDPDASESILVKRVAGVDRNSVRVEGDNFGASRDSRHFGPVPRSAIIGRVLFCYWSPYHPSQAGR